MSRKVPVSREQRDALLELENVIGHGIGYAYVDGERTDHVCVIAFVTEKVPEDKLDEADIVPEVLDGIRTDVIQSGEPQSVDGPYSDADGGPKGSRNDVIRPLVGGVEIYGGDAENFGSLGTGLLKMEDGTPVAISNRHVVCNEDNDCTGEDVFQGSEPDGDGGYDFDTEDQFIGTVKSLGELDDDLSGEDADENLDVAYIELEDPDDTLARMWGLGEMLTPSDAGLGDLVVNNGRTTGLTAAYIEAVDVTINVGFEFGSVALTGLDELGKKVIPGDSGSTYGRITPEGNYRPTGVVMATNQDDDLSWQHPFSDVTDDLGFVERGSFGEASEVGTDADSSPWFESVIYRVEERVGSVDVELLVANTGGSVPDSDVQVRLYDSDESVVDEISILPGNIPSPGEPYLDTYISEGSLDETLLVETTWEYDGNEYTHEDEVSVAGEPAELVDWGRLMQVLNNIRVVDESSDIPDGVDGFYYVIEDGVLRYEGPESMEIASEEQVAELQDSVDELESALGGYEIQKDGDDTEGVINFKTMD